VPDHGGWGRSGKNTRNGLTAYENPRHGILGHPAQVVLGEAVGATPWCVRGYCQHGRGTLDTRRDYYQDNLEVWTEANPFVP
jgi:hypothetical protein